MDKLLSLWVVLALAGCDQPGGRAGGIPSDATVSTEPGPDVTASSDTTTTPDATTVAQDSSVAQDTSVAPDSGGPPPVVDPSCTDGQFDEALPADSADIAAPIAAFSSATYKEFVLAVLAVRYPFGQELVQAGVTGGPSVGQGNCIDTFTSNRNTAKAVISNLSTVVHECGHIADIAAGGFSNAAYLVNADVTFKCPSASAPGKTFARSLLNDDDYASLNPNDFYRDVYLDGDPSDGTFDSGDQGYDMVLEEATQYVNSLATDWAFRDQYPRGQSITARDGILTFLWYVERYLHLARLEHPQAYTVISGNKCWRDATLTMWGRAWLYLDLSDGESALGIDDAFLEDLVMDPDLLGEIDRIRSAAGCP
ncbi:MAG: hypothetical protein U1F43_02985 [Myxococcota bacterium]